MIKQNQKEVRMKQKDKITRKEFKEGKFKVISNQERRDHPVAKFLRENKGFAFRVDGIVTRTKLNKNSIRGILRKLKKDKLVIHKSPYFIWK